MRREWGGRLAVVVVVIVIVIVVVVVVGFALETNDKRQRCSRALMFQMVIPQLEPLIYGHEEISCRC